MIRAGLVALALASAAPAAAQSCAPAERVRATLAQQFGESLRFRGAAAAGVVEVWLSPAGGWTVLYIRDGTACLLAAGNAGVAIAPGVPL